MSWLEARHEAVYYPQLADDLPTLRKAIYKTEALLLPRKLVVTQDFLECGPRLKAIARLHEGSDNTDTEACRERMVRVIQCATANVRSNAEYLLGGLLALYRRGIVSSLQGIRHAEIRQGRELNGSVVGILGLSPSAHALAILLQAVGARLIGYDPAVHRSAPLFKRLEIEPVSLVDLMSQSDAVSMQMVHASRYERFVNANVLEHCKPGQIWVSTSRSRLFDVDALAQAGGSEIVAIPAGTEIGGISLPAFTLSRNGDQLIGTADGAEIPVLEKKVDLRFVLSGGEFQQASGAISVQIPVGTTGAFIDRLRFTVVAKPDVRLIGNAHLTAVGGVVTADGELNLRPSPFNLRISGTASIIDTIPLGSAAVEIGGGRVAFAGQVGFSFGPASLNAAVGGAFSPSAFNVEGHGSACFFACVGADAVLSSRGAAACGTLDFGLVEVSAGFGLLYGRGPDIFATGCSIAPYRTNVLASGVRAEGRPRALVGGGAPEGFDVPDKLALVSVIAKAAPGRPAPRVIVTPPGGAPIALPADRVGGYRFDDATGSLIDVDPAASQTRVLVSAPAPGRWSIQAEAGSEPVVSVDVNRALPNVERAALTKVAVTDVADATAQAAITAARDAARNAAEACGLPADQFLGS